ncbi:unnamed protein product [Meganyctiphanes norvegica]|uniref:Ankyrin repeat domain-containing protein n=1 Tax=Meganyctiphanes norvegica TaxID=48144 RepID=A0AAV2RDB3_MEGNR
MAKVYLPGSKEYMLVRAAYDGKLEDVLRLIPEVETVNGLAGREWSPATALWWACRRGHPQVAKALLQNGANVVIQCHYGWTALTAVLNSTKPWVVSSWEWDFDSRREVLLILLQSLPPSQLRDALTEVENWRPGLVTPYIVASVIPSLQNWCKEVILRHIHSDKINEIRNLKEIMLPMKLIQDLEASVKAWYSI